MQRCANCARSPRPCSYCERRNIIITLLRTFRDAVETLQRGDEGGKMVVGSRLLTMPAAWHAGCKGQCVILGGDRPCESTFAFLVDALVKLRQMGPRHYWNVKERYIASERVMRNLINRGGDYFAALEHVSYVAGERHSRFSVNARLPRNAEVLSAVAQPKATIVRKPGDPRMVLVRATVETWDAGVEPRPLSTGLDFLSAYMPKKLEVPREVPVAA